ncbi:MAG: hypothetical protein ACI9T9_002626 [Oleiphilaceae bacterium]
MSPKHLTSQSNNITAKKRPPLDAASCAVY